MIPGVPENVLCFYLRIMKGYFKFTWYLKKLNTALTLFKAGM
jgi:hypothetical protein